MTYLSYANTCAIVIRNCLKEPFKTQAATREHAYYKVQTYVDGVAQKPGAGQFLSILLSVYVYIVLACVVYAVLLFLNLNDNLTLTSVQPKQGIVVYIRPLAENIE